MREQYRAYDEELLKNDFLHRHTECLPFIGEKYKEIRLLLIGESHYVPKRDICFVNREDYYDCGYDDLDKGDYKTWINTRAVFEYRVYERRDFKNFFSNPATEIARVINHTDNLTKDQRIEAMHNYAFFNYFKRPSYDKGKSIKGLSDIDYNFAYDVSCFMIKILDPQLIVFLSKKAYKAFCESDRDKNLGSHYSIRSVSHPSSAWWNRVRNDGACARDEFYEYVKHCFMG